LLEKEKINKKNHNTTKTKHYESKRDADDYQFFVGWLVGWLAVSFVSLSLSSSCHTATVSKIMH